MRLPPELALPWRIYQAIYPKDHEAAELFYLAEILPRELAVLRRTHQDLPTYASTIHTLGQSIEAPVITAALLGARRVHLLATEATAPLVERLRLLLPHAEITHSLILHDELDAVVQAASQAAAALPHPLALDMTGGTKVMAAGMALAAEKVKADLYYLSGGGKQNPYRRPLPASERLVLVRKNL